MCHPSLLWRDLFWDCPAQPVQCTCRRWLKCWRSIKSLWPPKYSQIIQILNPQNSCTQIRKKHCTSISCVFWLWTQCLKELVNVHTDAKTGSNIHRHAGFVRMCSPVHAGKQLKLQRHLKPHIQKTNKSIRDASLAPQFSRLPYVTSFLSQEVSFRG